MQGMGWKIALLALAVFAIAAATSELQRASGQPSNSMVTLTKAATIRVDRPPRANSGAFIDVGVRAYTPPTRGGVEAVVTLSASAGDRKQEIGRFTIFPNAPFVANNTAQERTFRLDATAALSAFAWPIGPVEVNVALDRLVPDTSDDARLTVGRIASQPRT